MKFHLAVADTAAAVSHPARGAWIEIERELAIVASLGRRTPQGVRGLKSAIPVSGPVHVGSHPARGAWIEIAPAAWPP